MPAFLLIIFAGLVIRLLFVGNTGFIADISFWKSWSMAAVDHGIVWTVLNTNINYPPGFIYVLWFMGKLYSIFGNAHDYYSFWKENNFAFLLSSKSVGIAADVVVAALIYWFFSQKEKLQKLGASITDKVNSIPVPLLLSSIFFLNPVVLLDSAWWGQVESFGLMFTLAAIILLFYKKPLLATSLFTIGFLMKLQNIIFIPIYFIFIFRYFDLKTTIKSLGIATLTFFAVNIPFIMQNRMDKVMYLLTVNSDYFPWLSLNAHNLWWIVAGTKGMTTSDKITVLGILNAKTVGLILFSSCYLLCCILIYLKTSARNLFLTLTLAIYSFFLFTTESHERYSYPVIVFLLFFFPFINEKMSQNTNFIFKKLSKYIKNPTQTFFWLLYILFAITVFFNMHTGLILNYPKNGIFLLTRITTPFLTILNSYISIFLFFPLLIFIFSQISILYLFASLAFLIAGLTGLQFSYLTKGQVSLTKFKPVIKGQDYASVQINKSVKSHEGWREWSRLSNNYFYYRKGFGSHANSKLVFDINRKFSKFVTDYGLDTNAGTPATAVFKIFADGNELFTSDKQGRFDFPGHVEVDIKDVKYLGLEINDAGDGISHDHADWFNPMLYK